MKENTKQAALELAGYTVMNEENYVHEELANGIPPVDTILWCAYEVQKSLGVSELSPVERFRAIGIQVTDDGATYYDEEVEENT
jgi:hypothetical protein